MFHATFGYYADGVATDTAVLPSGWEGRLVAIRNQNTLGKTCWCLEIHDLVVSKHVAGREKDREFVREAIRHGLVDARTLEERLRATPLPEERRAAIAAAMRADLATSGAPDAT